MHFYSKRKINDSMLIFFLGLLHSLSCRSFLFPNTPSYFFSVLLQRHEAIAGGVDWLRILSLVSLVVSSSYFLNAITCPQDLWLLSLLLLYLWLLSLLLISPVIIFKEPLFRLHFHITFLQLESLFEFIHYYFPLPIFKLTLWGYVLL